MSLTSGATWKQGQWTKDEVDILQENIADYCRVSVFSKVIHFTLK